MRKLFLCLLLSKIILPLEAKTAKGLIIQNQNSLGNSSSFNQNQIESIIEGLQMYEYQDNRDTFLLIDPLGGGMINLNEGGKNYIYFYPDVNTNVGVAINYVCDYKFTLDQLTGTHVQIGGFYYMDEMLTPVLAAADGIVTYTDDGNFDRWQFGDNSQNASSNVISIIHSGGYYTTYSSLKRNSILVAEGDTVQAGDTIGYPGSSHQLSQTPHLLFEVGNLTNNTAQHKNPWDGECELGRSMWVNQLPYIGDSTTNKRQVVQFLHTAYPINVDPFDWNTWNYAVWENIPSLNHLNPGEYAQDILIINNLLKTDTLKNYLYLEGNLVEEIDWVPGNSEFWWTGNDPAPTQPWFWYGPFNQNFPHGNYTKKFFINDSLVGSNEFVVDDLPNQAPVVASQFISVDLSQTVEGEFSASDPDGNIFWYNLDSPPGQGSIEIYGGRKRKFRYYAPEDYTGSTTISVSATDDKGLTGASTLMIINIVGELSSQNQVMVENFRISEAFPNPFNPNTTLKFNVQKEVLVKITIYNQLGKRVKDLVNENYAVGTHSVTWNSTNNQGKQVSAGMYIYTIQAGEFRATKKMVLLK